MKARLRTLIPVYIMLIILAAIMLYPIGMIVNLSFMKYKAFLREPLALVNAQTFTTENFGLVFDKLKVFTRFFNTIWMTLTSCLLTCSISALAAFPIARKHFKASEKTYAFILLSMFFPGSLVANIILLKDFLFIYGTPVALILVWVVGGIQVNVFMFVGFIKQLPRDIDEAAMIDGCGYYRYIFTIAVPLMTPIISTVFIFKAIGCWNDFVGPLIYLRGDEFKTLSVGLYYFKGEFASKWNQFSAAILTIAAPMMVLYIFMQRFIIEGMTSGALKG